MLRLGHQEGRPGPGGRELEAGERKAEVLASRSRNKECHRGSWGETT